MAAGWEGRVDSRKRKFLYLNLPRGEENFCAYFSRVSPIAKVGPLFYKHAGTVCTLKSNFEKLENKIRQNRPNYKGLYISV